MEIFNHIPPIKYEGAKSKNPKPNGVRFRDLLVTLSGLEPEFAP